MKINMKNLIVVSIVVIIFLVTIIICVKTFQNNQTTTIITDSMASVGESITIASNPTSTSTNGEFEVEDDSVIMSVTNTNGNYISQTVNITSSNNLIYGDGWVATQGYDPNEGKTTNTANANTKPTVPEDIQKKMGMSEGLVRYSVGLDNDMEHTFQLIVEALKEINFI